MDNAEKIPTVVEFSIAYRKAIEKIYSSKEEYQSVIDNNIPRRIALQEEIAFENKEHKQWYLSGFCQYCDKPTYFFMDWLHATDNMPNFRERLKCSRCGLNTRLRVISSFAKNVIKEKNLQDIYLYEQATKFFKLFCEKVKKENTSVNIVGSEYLGEDKASGQVYNGICHQDACNLSFEDKSFDLLISNDVLEHIFDIDKALGESFRVLKDNGLFIVSIPFNHLQQNTITKAKIEDGKIVNLEPESYHANPIDKKGSLVVYDYGWDFLDKLKQAGFSKAYVIDFYSLFFGYIGHGGAQIICVAEK